MARIRCRKIKRCPGYKVGENGSVWTCWIRVGKGLGANGGRYSGKTCGWTWQMNDTWTKMKPCKTKRGYIVIGLRQPSGGSKQFYVHDLVLTAFLGPRPTRNHQACHFPDRNPANCNLDNLRWGTAKDNRNDSVVHGTQVRGEKTGTAVLTEAEAKQVIRRLKKGESKASIARDLKIGETTVRNIAQNKTWRHVPR